MTAIILVFINWILMFILGFSIANLLFQRKIRKILNEIKVENEVFTGEIKEGKDKDFSFKDGYIRGKLYVIDKLIEKFLIY